MNHNGLLTLFFSILVISLCAVAQLHADELPVATDPGTYQETEASLLKLFSDGEAGDAAQQRPEDVTALEWLVLSREARADADPEARLAQLLGNLRFSKALQAFRQSGSVELGEQLLQVLPERVREGAMPADRAQRLQMQILSVLEPEDDLRQQRLQDEARRIGVGFEVRKVTS